jgi:hypothetical protein
MKYIQAARTRRRSALVSFAGRAGSAFRIARSGCGFLAKTILSPMSAVSLDDSRRTGNIFY